MPVRKIKSSWWTDFCFNGARYRMRSPENTRDGASAYELVLRGRLARGESIRENPEEKPAFRAFAEEWRETYVRTNNRLSEQRSKETILRVHLAPFFGSLRLDEISAKNIERFKAVKLAEGLCAKTVNNILIVLSKCLHSALEWSVIEKVPRIQMLRTRSQRLDFLTPVETGRLLSYAAEPVWHDMALLALRTGMRRGELLALDWSDVDFKRRKITVARSCVLGVIDTPKNNRVRHLPLSSDAADALALRRQARGLVFCNPETPDVPFTKSNAASGLDRVCSRSGVRRVTWHTLRHTFASQLVAAGVSLQIVQELLGHSSIVMTTRYAHLAPSALGDAVNLLSELERREAANQGNGPSTVLGSAHAVPLLPSPRSTNFPLRHTENAPLA